MSDKNSGFYFSETVGFKPDTKKVSKKSKGEIKDGKEKNKDNKNNKTKKD